MKEKLEKLNQRIHMVCGKAGRDPDRLRLIAVSKMQPLAKIEALFRLGQKEFGENYAQELQEKALALASTDIRWVFIGRLQSNKIKRIVQFADEIQSVTDIKQASLISRYASEFKKEPYPIYLSVNLGGEVSKAGVGLAQVMDLCQTVQDQFPNLCVEGLMCIPPIYESGEEEKRTQAYRSLRESADHIGKGCLSLGMSKDLEAAIFAGSNCLRIGSDLFGSREK